MPAGWVAGGVAGAGALENIFGNNSANDAVKANNKQAGIVNQATDTMLSEAQQVANQPYVPYTGEYGAPLSSNQGQAVALASKDANAGTGQGLVEQGVNEINQEANNNFTPQNIAKYENPYTSSVVANEIEQANRSYDQSVGQAKIHDAQSSAFGGSGTAIEMGELAGQNQLNIGQLTATGYSNAYNAAVNAWQADNQRMSSAAQSYEQAGGDITQMNSNDIQQLLQTGGAAQAVAQTNLTGQYNEFLRQQGWSANQLQTLINGVGVAGKSTQQINPQYQSNVANSLLGLGSTLAGLYGGGFFNSSSSTPSYGGTSTGSNGQYTGGAAPIGYEGG